jgi:hypothetical protein
LKASIQELEAREEDLLSTVPAEYEVEIVACNSTCVENCAIVR